MSTQDSHPDGWLRARLKPFGWSVRRFAQQINQPYSRVMRWNSGRGVPPAMEDWLAKFDAFLANQPPPEPEVLAKPKPPKTGPTAFVRRIMAVMQPGEAMTTVELSERLKVSQKTLVNRLLDAAQDDRLAPLRRIEAEKWPDPSLVHWMLPGQEFPDEKIDPEPSGPAMTAFISKIVDALPAGEEIEIRTMAKRLQIKPAALEDRLLRAEEDGLLGPLEIVDGYILRRIEAEPVAGDFEEPATIAEADPSTLNDLVQSEVDEIDEAEEEVEEVEEIEEDEDASVIIEKKPRMTPQEFRHATDVLGLGEREIIQQTSMLPGQFDRMLSGEIPVPPTLEAWLLASLEMKRQKELQEKWLQQQQESEDEVSWAQECMNYLGWNHTQLGKIVGIRDPREPRRWFTSSLPEPVADLLERACLAKESAIEALPDDLDETQAAAAVSAAVMASLGDLTKIRDAILEEKHAQTKAHWETKTAAHDAVLHWVTEGAYIPEDDPAHADIKAALAATSRDGQSAGTWAHAAIAWLEKEGYGSEDDPLHEILGTDHPSEQSLLRTPGRYVVDLTRRSNS